MIPNKGNRLAKKWKLRSAMAAMTGEYLCDASELTNGGPGFRFSVHTNTSVLPAFAIRFHNQVYAYLNRCAHRELELDMMPGRFFDNEKRHLICSTHGAVFQPDSGECIFGPCLGGQLTSLQVLELEQGLFLTDNVYHVVQPGQRLFYER